MPLPVDFAAVADLDNQDGYGFVLDITDDAVVANSILTICAKSGTRQRSSQSAGIDGNSQALIQIARKCAAERSVRALPALFQPVVRNQCAKSRRRSISWELMTCDFPDRISAIRRSHSS